MNAQSGGEAVAAVCSMQATEYATMIATKDANISPMDASMGVNVVA